jgi:N-alpha-acetyltransferase 35, NatC auxiliary subunit
MAWHIGHPLSQTLFTSLYLDKLLWPVPNSLENACFSRGKGLERATLEMESPMTHLILRSYCLALVKSCDLVHARIVSEYYYEAGILFWAAYNMQDN